MAGTEPQEFTPQSFVELMVAIDNLLQNSPTIEEARQQVHQYLTNISSDCTLAPSIHAIRTKAYAAAEERRKTQPFEMRWRASGGEVVHGWESLRDYLKNLGLFYKVSTLKARLCADRNLDFTAVNPDTGLEDVLTIIRVKAPKGKVGRPSGISVKVRTKADAIRKVVNPTGNKLRRLYDDLA